MYSRCNYPLQILFVYFLILPSLLQPSILFNCFYTCTIYNEKYFSDSHSSYNYSPCHYMRAWIRVLDAPGCYERAALQDSGLVSSPVATFEQSENVAIAHLVGAACFEGCGLCNRFHLRMRTVLMGNLAQEL